MTHIKKLILGPLFSILMIQSAMAADKGGAFLNAKDAGPAFQLQGEYVGKRTGVQVIALGDGKFRAVIHKGGLPGAGWDKGKKIELNEKGVITSDPSINKLAWRVPRKGWDALKTNI